MLMMQFFTSVLVRTSSLLLALYSTSMMRVFRVMADTSTHPPVSNQRGKQHIARIFNLTEILMHIIIIMKSSICLTSANIKNSM